MQTVTYTVPGISCGHCTHTIQTELSEMEGITSVTAAIDTKEVVVTYDDPVTENEIVALLKEINYAPVIA